MIRTAELILTHFHLPLVLGRRSGRNGSFFNKITLSYMLGANKLAMELEIIVAINVGIKWVISPDNSNAIKDVEIVWVTAPENAAAPTMA